MHRHASPWVSRVMIAFVTVAFIWWATGLLAEWKSINNISKNQQRFSCPKWEEWRNKFRQCSQLKYSTVKHGQLFEMWHNLWMECAEIFNIDNKFSLLAYSNQGEQKIAVSSAEEFKNASCIFVTLGIGGSVRGEMAFRKYNPNCRFFGADPIEENNKDAYSSFGKYFQIAVSDVSDEITANVFSSGNYTKKTVSAVELRTFLLSYVNETAIDHMWMDIEGPEHRLLPQMVKEGILDQSGITVCQLNVEMHSPFPEYGTTAEEYANMIVDFQTNSNFLLLHVVILQGAYTHQRLFFLNGFDSYCVQRYLGHWCE